MARQEQIAEAVQADGAAADPRWKEKALEVLVAADIRVGGDRPWDIEVHDDRLWHRALTQGNLGLGEAYMEGWWDVKALDQFFYRLIKSGAPSRVQHNVPEILQAVRAKLFNLQKRSRAAEVAEAHYDLGYDLFSRMLDKRMTYSCGYWKNAKTLDKAQEAKLELIADKLHLDRGMRVLDIGCGWGGLAEYFARTRGVSVVGLTVSRDQAERARERCAGLDVDIHLADYRELQGETFDRVVSVGMFEHVGAKNHGAYFRTAREALEPDGLMLLQTIARPRTVVAPDAWTNKYVFPNGQLPSLRQVAEAAEGRFVVEDVHNIGAHYDRTLMAWHASFAKNWRKLRDAYGETFRRMWDYYLLSSAGSFRARYQQCYQVVLSPGGVDGGYAPVR